MIATNNYNIYLTKYSCEVLVYEVIFMNNYSMTLKNILIKYNQAISSGGGTFIGSDNYIDIILSSFHNNITTMRKYISWKLNFNHIPWTNFIWYAFNGGSIKLYILYLYMMYDSSVYMRAFANFFFLH